MCSDRRNHKAKSFQYHKFAFVIVGMEKDIIDTLKIKDLKTTNRDCKKANNQDIRYCSIDSNGH